MKPMLMDMAMAPVAILDAPVQLSYEMKHNELCTAELTLAGEDPCAPLVREPCLIRLWDGDRDLGVYRVSGMPEADFRRGGTVTVSLEHALAMLLDDVVFGEMELEEAKIGDAIRQVLDRQTEQRWVLGDCEFEDTVNLAVGNDTLLSIIRKVCAMLPEDYCWAYDTQCMPFRLHIRRADQDNGCGIHVGRSMVGVKQQVDMSGMVTRLYLLGGADADGKQVTVEGLTEGGVPYIDADTTGKWGVRAAIYQNGDITDAQELMRRGMETLEKRKNPICTWEASAIDLYGLTGYEWDRYATGKKVLVLDDASGIHLSARITGIRKPDVYGDPGNVIITIQNRMPDEMDTVTAIAKKLQSVESSGIGTRGGVNATSGSLESAWTQILQNEHLISLSATKANLNELGEKVSEDVARIDLTYDHILTQIYQNGEVMTQINQTVEGIDAWSKDTEGNLADLLVTANAIKGQVTSVEGDVGKLMLSSDEFRTTLQSGDTVLSEIRQTQDEISQTVNDNNGTIGALTVKADSIIGKITSADNRISQLQVRTDGLTYTLEQNSETLALFDVNQQHMLTQIGSSASSIGSLEVKSDRIIEKVEDVRKGVGKFQVTADMIKGEVQGIDGRVGDLELRSDSFDVAIGKDGLGGKINMIEGLLDLKVEGGGNTVSVRLDAFDNSISLKADTTYVDKLVAKEITAVKASFDELLAGYVKTEDFEAVTGWTENFAGHSISADYITCGTGDFDDLVFGTLAGENCSWKSKTVMTGIQSITQNKRFLTLMKGDGTTVTLDIVTDVSITPSKSTINYLGKD